MNDGLLDAVRYSDWATRGLLRFCGEQAPETLAAAAVGSYGSIIETLNHVLEAETYYLDLLTGSRPSWEWQLDGGATLEQMGQSVATLAAEWEKLLSAPFDANVLITRVLPWTDRSGIVIVQAIHHGNVHREQVNMILTAQGIEPPDLDVWQYQAWQQANESPP